MSLFRSLVLLPAAAIIIPASAQGASDGRRQVLDIVVAKGRLSSEATVVKMHKGDELLLNVTSDVEDEIHVHGLEARLRLLPGKVGSLAVNATRTGRFPIELHRAEVTIAVLEVYPS